MYFNNFEIVACADIKEEASKAYAKNYNVKQMSVGDLLNNQDIQLVINLTIPNVHFEVSQSILKAKKHSYSEKPLSIEFEDGKKLVELAKENNVYVGCAPDTFLGGGGQLARQKIDDGEIGKILTGNFIFAFPGVETFHPNPESWFLKGGGPIIDMGPYFFTTLVNLLGPAKNVRARGKKFTNQREYQVGPKKGQMFNVEILTSVMFDVEFHNDAINQGFISFDVENHGRNHMELYGTNGSIIVPDPNMFGGPVITSKELGSEWNEYSVEDKYLGKTNIINSSVRSNEAPKQANYRGVGLAEMIYSIENNLEHRCNGELALHVLELIESTIKSAETSTEVGLETICKKPTPFTEDQIKIIMK